MKKGIAAALKRAKLVIYMLMILFMPGLCLAIDHVVISEALYDPVGTETGGEAVVLYNPTGSDIDISGYIIMTESSATDATVPAGTLLAPGQSYLIADAGWSTLRDNASWNDADHEEAITLSNTDAGVAAAYPNGTVIDALGWGSAAGIGAGLYEGEPALPATAGLSLRRIYPDTDTDDNFADFVEGEPQLLNSESPAGETGGEENRTGGEAINLSITVTNTPPHIDSIALSPDDSGSTGVQVMPVPEGNREIAISAEVTDPDGISPALNVRATITGPEWTKTLLLGLAEQTNITTAEYNETLEMQFYDDAGEYTVTITANDSAATAGSSAVFEYMSMAAITIDTTALQFTGARPGQTASITGDFALSTQDSPTIRNAGNTQIDIGLYATDLTDGTKRISAGNIAYSFDNDFGSPLSGILANSMKIQALGLMNSADSVTSLGFQLNIPQETQNGNYTGQVTIVAVSS